MTRRPHLLDALRDQVLLCDGGMGSRVQALTLEIERDFWNRENCTEVLNLSRPELVREIHRGYFEAGADMVETNTFGGSPITLAEAGGERYLRIPGDLDVEQAAEIEEAVWDRMHFASHLRTQRLGEFTIGTDLHRSESLALVQLLILYHVATAKAAIALGGDGGRSRNESPPVTVRPEPEAATA